MHDDIGGNFVKKNVKLYSNKQFYIVSIQDEVESFTLIQKKNAISKFNQ